MIEKKKKYYSIGEVEKITKEPQHIIREWCTRLDCLNPKERGGQRRFTQEEIEIIELARHLRDERKFRREGVNRELNQRMKENKEKFSLIKHLKDLNRFLRDISKET